MCFDWDMLTRNEEIHFAGYLKCLTDDNPSPDSGVAVMDAGPLTEWWISGYGEGHNVTLGVSTETGHYYLTAPNEVYAPFFDKIKAKALLSKVVVDALMDAREEQKTLEYEDLLAAIETAEVPEGLSPLTNEMLVNNISFIEK